jgi:hypothetical protein
MSDNDVGVICLLIYVAFAVLGAIWIACDILIPPDEE